MLLDSKITPIKMLPIASIWLTLTVFANMSKLDAITHSIAASERYITSCHNISFLRHFKLCVGLSFRRKKHANKR